MSDNPVTYGPNPDPGGETDVDAPPYDGRSTARGDSESAEALTDSIDRQLDEVVEGEHGATASPAVESPVSEDEVAHGSAGSGEVTATDTQATSAKGVGQSFGRRGEDQADRDGKEEGREETGTEHASDRPTGTSDMRDSTGVAPDGADDAPDLQSGDQGG